MRRLAIYVLAVLAAISCTGDLPEIEDYNKLTSTYVPTALQQQISAEGNVFAIDMMKCLSSAENGNVLFSPFALRLSLAMAECGAGGSTRTAIHQAAGFGDFAQENICGYFRSMLYRMENTPAYASMQGAASLWTSRQMKCHSRYQKLIKSVFHADHEICDDMAKGLEMINLWAAKATGYRVSSVAGDLSGDLKPIWASAFSFEAPWADNTFDGGGVKEGLFFSNRSGVISIKSGTFLTTRLSNRQLYRCDDFCALSLNYEGNVFALYIVLPVETASVEEVIASLDANKWNEIIAGNYTSNVDMAIPEFAMDYSTDADLLRGFLSGRGMASAFDAKADFSVMTSSAAPIGLFLSGAAFGVEAGGGIAASSVAADAPAIQSQVADVLEFKADHPFAYFLVDKNSGSILMAGIQRTI